MEGITILRCGHEVCPVNKKPERVICRMHMLHFVVSGRGRFNNAELHANQVFLCREGTVNSWRPDPNDPWEYYWFDATGVVADKLLDDCFGDNSYIDCNFDDIFMQLLNISLKNNPELRAGLFVAVLGILNKKHDHEGLPMPELHIKNAEELIVSSGGKISVAELASSLGLSPAYLYNIFKKFRGKSVSQALLDYRMKCACELLVRTNYPIQLVAASVGYDDQFCFSKLFHQKFGLSPSRYRREQKRLIDGFAEEEKRNARKTPEG